MSTRNVLIDLDGVLCHLQSSILRLIGRHPPSNYPASDGDLIRHFGLPDEFVKDHFDYDFWATIPPTDEFDDIISLVESHNGRNNTYIITTAHDIRGCLEGKRLWIEKFLGRGYPGRTHFVVDKSSQARSGVLMIDDSASECRSFFEANGHAFLMPRPWNVSSEKQHEWKSLMKHSLTEFLAR